MKKTIALKIDVTKIEKARLFEGKKGTYLDAVFLYDSESDEYGNNGVIIQSVSKEEREQGVKGAILGNAKVLFSEENKPAKEPAKSADIPSDFDDVNDDLPF